MQHMRRCVYLSLLFLLAGGCWVSSDDPPGPTPCSGCNNNGQCELSAGEDCSCCPTDCPCCRAVEATGTDVQQAENATGDTDGQFAVLGASSTLTLQVGREIYAGDPAPASDFLLVGQVTSDSSVSLSSLCTAGFPSGDGYRVEGSVDGSNFEVLGYWTKSTNPPNAGGQGQPFSVACGAALSSIRFVRLSPVGGNAAAKLDALVATSCVK